MTDAREGVDPISDARPVYEVDIPVSALVKFAGVAIGTVLLLFALARAQQLVGLAIAAAIVAALLAPAVAALGRVVGRVAAAILLNLLLLVAIAGGVGAVVSSVQTESESLQEYTSTQLDELEANGGPTFLTRTRLDERVGDAVQSWGIGAVVGEDDAGGIANRVSELVLLIVFSVFFTLRGDAMLSTALGWTSDRDRRRVLREVWIEAGEQAAAYTRRSLGAAVVTGLVAAAVAWAFGLPAVFLIGVAAGLLSAIPVLGAVVGWLPIVLVAVVDRPVDGAVPIVVAAVAGVALTVALRARFVHADHHVGSFVVAFGIAAGLSAAGLPGAAAGMFLAIAVSIAARHDWNVVHTGDTDPERTSRSALVQTAARPVPQEDQEEGSEPRQRLLLQASRGTLLRVTGIVIVAFSIQLSISRIGPTLVWAVVGILIAIGLDRPVSWVERRAGVPRAVSIVVGAVLVSAGLAVLVSTASSSFGSSAVDTDVSDVVVSLEELPLVGDRLASLDLTRRFQEFQADAPQLVSSSSLSERALALLGGGLVGVFWILTITVACLLDGPRLVAAIDRRVPARFRRQSTRLARAGHGALSGYVAGSATVAALNGLIVGVLGFVVGVPAPALLALWAFSWNFVPQIGALVGWAPVLLLAFLVGPAQGAGSLAFFVVYQLVENNFVQPAIVGQAVDISPLSALSAALVGVTVAGLIGAILAIPFAGVVRALVAEWRRADFPSVRSGNDPPPAATHPPIP